MIEAARRLARASSARFRVAEVSEADVNLLEIELARFEQDLHLLELERRTEGMRLNQLLDLPPDPPVVVAGDLDSPRLAIDSPAALAAAALRRRPDLHGLRLERDRAEAEVRLARAEAWEDWTIEASYEYGREVFAD